jgi:hypothetical protein
MAAKPVGLNYMLSTGSRGPMVYLVWGIGFQEPQQLLQAQGNQAFSSRSSGSCLLGCGLQMGRIVALQAWGLQACGQWEFLGLIAAWISGSAVQWHCCQHRATKTVSLCLLLPKDHQELWVLLIHGSWFPCHFRVKVAGRVIEGNLELRVPVCSGKQDLSWNWCPVMETVATWRLFRAWGSTVLS